jgi:hypothetical protein
MCHHKHRPTGVIQANNLHGCSTKTAQERLSTHLASVASMDRVQTPHVYHEVVAVVAKPLLFPLHDFRQSPVERPVPSHVRLNLCFSSSLSSSRSILDQHGVFSRKLAKMGYRVIIQTILIEIQVMARLSPDLSTVLWCMGFQAKM